MYMGINHPSSPMASPQVCFSSSRLEGGALYASILVEHDQTHVRDPARPDEFALAHGTRLCP